MIVAAQIAAVWYATIIAAINLTSPTNAMFTDSVTNTSTFTAGTWGEDEPPNNEAAADPKEQKIDSPATDEQETEPQDNTNPQKEESIPVDGTASDEKEATVPEEQHPQPEETPKVEESEKEFKEETKQHDKDSNNQEPTHTTVDEHTTNGK